MRPPLLSGGNTLVGLQTVFSLLASMRPPLLGGGNGPMSCRAVIRCTASMRPPLLGGGNKGTRETKKGDVRSFNEAAASRRRK